MSSSGSGPSDASTRSFVSSDVEQNKFLCSSECDQFLYSSSDGDDVSVNDIFDQNESESVVEIDDKVKQLNKSCGHSGMVTSCMKTFLFSEHGGLRVPLHMIISGSCYTMCFLSQ